jgi:hypothetical protein
VELKKEIEAVLAVRAAVGSQEEEQSLEGTAV